MKKRFDNIIYQSDRQKIIDLYLTDIEKFRKSAEESYKRLSKIDRKNINIISSKDKDGFSILNNYMVNIHDKVIFLHNKISEKNFKKYISKNLLIDDELKASKKVKEILINRIDEIQNNFIFNIYSTDNKIYESKINKLKEILSFPEEEIVALHKKLIINNLFKEIAENYNVTVFDPNTNFLKRISAKIHIRKERRNIMINLIKRKKFVLKRIEEIETSNDSIIFEIYKYNWELMELISLRNNYDKKINQLPKSQSNNPIKRLEVFDQITSDFKKKLFENNLIKSDIISLEQTRGKIKEIDSILLRVFDLSNLQKNQLVLQMKEYKDLICERNKLNI